MASHYKNTFLQQFLDADVASIQPNQNTIIQLRKLLDNSGALLLKNMSLNKDTFHFLSQAISLNTKVNASIFERRIPQAKDAPLFHIPDFPLHTDGIIIQQSTDAIVFYAQHVAHNTSGAGDLILSNHAKAFALMPISMRNVLVQHGLEYLVLDRRPFPFLPEGWFSIPSLRKINEQLYLYLALPFSPEQSEFWQVRIKGMLSATSETFLRELREYLMQDEFFIRHSWQTGDLILVDNRQVFHGFHTTTSDTQIHLYRQNIALL
ncbi:TauD/TfdA family dioxygenase [Acinetobacter sp. 3657]|uniref:TauD/TfdA family dioxygenase n=1 Tax=Acinetobacter sp. 3657 TaxID=2817764 RepID=UPI002857D1C9|nr:(5R)-carbapenem-3-carboxylate synthase [Prolinoborus sp. 3657]